MFHHPLRREPAVLLQRPTRPVNHRPANPHRPMGEGASPNRQVGEPGSPGAAGGELARDPRLALVEAALIAADEPLTLRRLAVAATLSDAAEARRLIRRLQELYDRDGT